MFTVATTKKGNARSWPTGRFDRDETNSMRRSAIVTALLLLAACSDTDRAAQPPATSGPSSTTPADRPTTALPADSASCGLVSAAFVTEALGADAQPRNYEGGCLYSTADGAATVLVTLLGVMSANGQTPADMVANARAAAGSVDIPEVEGVYVQGGPALAELDGSGISVTVTGVADDKPVAVTVLIEAVNRLRRDG